MILKIDNTLLINNNDKCFRVFYFFDEKCSIWLLDLLFFAETNDNSIQSQITKTFKFNISLIFWIFSDKKGKYYEN